MDLLLAQAIRREHTFFGRTVAQTARSCEYAHGSGAEAYRELPAPQPFGRTRCYVPQACAQAIGKGTQLYQFTAIDEYSRKRYLEGFSDNSSYSAAIFARNAARYFRFKIKCIQTDNGQEFTKAFSSRYTKETECQPTLFQTVLKQMGIRHKQIRPYTPRHNGKVERSHRKDGERFYAGRKFYSLEDYNKQLKRYMNEYNNFPMRPLNWLSPNEYLASFFSKQSVTNV